MNDKRFVLDELYCYVIQDNKKRLTDKQVVDLLNKLYEENEQLKKELNNLKKDEKKKEIYTTSKRPMRFVGGRKK